jgi:hypothetical protein
MRAAAALYCGLRQGESRGARATGRAFLARWCDSPIAQQVRDAQQRGCSFKEMTEHLLGEQGLELAVGHKHRFVVLHATSTC